MDWKKLLAYITGSIDEELLLRNEYLVTENRILRAQIKGRPQLTDGERRTLAAIGRKLGRKILEEVASRRPRVDKEVEELVVRLAKENRTWGYDRIAGAIAQIEFLYITGLRGLVTFYVLLTREIRRLRGNLVADAISGPYEVESHA